MGVFNRIVEQIIDEKGAEIKPAEQVLLTVDERRQSRIITKTQSGHGCVIALERGLTLRGGTVLADANGNYLLIGAAPEEVSTVRASDSLGLVRLAYHLGNRHVPLEIKADYLRYQRDHVLDAMVEGLGGKVTAEFAPFEPEDGAYSHHH